jgi:hypothetical protein
MPRFPRLALAALRLLLVAALLSTLSASAAALWVIFTDHYPSHVCDLQISPDGSVLALALSGGDCTWVLLCDARSGTELRSAQLTTGRPLWVKISMDCNTWAALFDGGCLELGRLASGERRRAQLPERLWDSYLGGVSGDGTICAVGGGVRVAVIDVETARDVAQFTAPATRPGRLWSLSVRADGRQVAAAFDNTVEVNGRQEWQSGIAVWDISNGTLLKRLPAGVVSLTRLAWVGEDAIAGLNCGSVDGPAEPITLRSVATGKTRVLAQEVRSQLFGPFNPGSSFGGALCAAADATALATDFGQADLAVLDAATLRPKYPRLRSMGVDADLLAASDGGAQVACAYGHTPGVFVADMQGGAVRQLRPHRNNVPRILAVVAIGGVLVAGCLWLLARTVRRRGSAPSGEPAK